jgi:hypothetical protein
MAIDILQKSICTHDYSSYNYNDWMSGTGPETIDGNESTCWAVRGRQYGAGDFYAWVQPQHEWTIPITLTSVYCNGYQQVQVFPGATRNYAYAYFYFDLKINGSWTNIATWASGKIEPVAWAWIYGYAYFNGGNYTYAGPWDNVTGFRVKPYGHTHQEGGGGEQESHGYVYEMKAWGTLGGGIVQII